jgi:hypothetical protein
LTDYICGSETIILNSVINPVSATFDKGVGTQTVDFSTEISKITIDDPNCPIVSYQIIDSALNPYTGAKFVI